MSTQPVQRKRPFERRRPFPIDGRLDGRRVMLVVVLVAAAFGIGLLAGRTKGTPALTERPLPGLPAVATPVASSLEAVPALETGTLQAPPQPAPVVREPAGTFGGATTTAPTTIAPSTSAPATSAPATTPAEHVTAPAPVEHARTPAPATKPPAPSSHGGGSGSGSSGSSGSGTSFESSD